MYRLVYVSTARIGLDPEEIGRILDVSQSNNHERYITRFLAYNDGHFMQALEGAFDEVREIYDRIRMDDRHHGVIQILGEEIDRRAFPDWSMNYFRVDDHTSRAMVVRRDDPIDGLLPADMPRELLHLFARFMQIDPLNA